MALALLTESFAVRALLGSLTAAALAALAVRAGLTTSVRARRLLLLAPLLAAAAAAVATALTSGPYLPQLLVLPGTADLRDLVAPTQPGLNLLLVVHAAIAVVLLVRRLLGLYATGRVVGRGHRPDERDARVAAALTRIAGDMRLAVPTLVLVPRCPGGAFAAGLRRPLVAVDPALVATLDDGELDGLLAHELAHLRRRDPLLSLLVGAFRDVTFFLPTLVLTARWLHREQEESADELAARATGRPVALASGILKVSQRGVSSAPAMACPAVPGRRPALALSGGQALVAVRVERLIGERPRPSRRRTRAELALAGIVLSVGLVAALSVPEWIVEGTGAEEVWVPFQTSTRAAEGLAESPAFATFRSLTAVPAGAPDEAPAPSRSVEDICPCVESQAQLHEGIAATAQAGRRLRWSGRGNPQYDIPNNVRVREVLSLEQGPRVGVFLVGDGSHPDRP